MPCASQGWCCPMPGAELSHLAQEPSPFAPCPKAGLCHGLIEPYYFGRGEDFVVVSRAKSVPQKCWHLGIWVRSICTVKDNNQEIFKCLVKCIKSFCEAGANPQKERDLIQILRLDTHQLPARPAWHLLTLRDKEVTYEARPWVPAHIPTQPPGGSALGSDAAALSTLVWSTCSPVPRCAGTHCGQNYYKAPRTSCVGSASSATLHSDQCQVGAAHRADVMLAHGWVLLSAATNKHHQTCGGGSCAEQRRQLTLHPLPPQCQGRPGFPGVYSLWWLLRSMFP